MLCHLSWPVFLYSTTTSCCCTFSNFASPKNPESNPWRNNFVEGKIWDHPSKMTQEWPNLGVGSSYGTNKPPLPNPSRRQQHDRTKMINLENKEAKRRRASESGLFKRMHSASRSSSLQRSNFVSCWIVEKKYYYIHGVGEEFDNFVSGSLKRRHKHTYRDMPQRHLRQCSSTRTWFFHYSKSYGILTTCLQHVPTPDPHRPFHALACLLLRRRAQKQQRPQCASLRRNWRLRIHQLYRIDFDMVKQSSRTIRNWNTLMEAGMIFWIDAQVTLGFFSACSQPRSRLLSEGTCVLLMENCARGL